MSRHRLVLDRQQLPVHPHSSAWRLGADATRFQPQPAAALLGAAPADGHDLRRAGKEASMAQGRHALTVGYTP
jgi:hypothetical protein